jgi:hypothetical protein
VPLTAERAKSRSFPFGCAQGQDDNFYEESRSVNFLTALAISGSLA